MGKDIEIHIPVNRTRLKLIGFLYGVLTILVLIVFFLLGDYLGDGWKLGLRITGGVLATLLVLTGSGAVKLLQNKKAGFHITSAGIEDISTAIGVGQIDWKSIAGIEIRKDEKLILIFVKKPDEIIKSAGNKAIRQLLEKNLSIYKTPVVVESKYLQCTFEDFGNKLEDAWKNYGTKKK